jgi:ABC-type multidrug transport system fused ATPase/permease subunit
VRQADRIAVIEAGRVVEFGSREALLARAGGSYRRLVETEASSARDAETA